MVLERVNIEHFKDFKITRGLQLFIHLGLSRNVAAEKTVEEKVVEFGQRISNSQDLALA